MLKMSVVQTLSIRLVECSEIREGRFMVEMVPFSKMLSKKCFVLAFSWDIKQFMLRSPII